MQLIVEVYVPNVLHYAFRVPNQLPVGGFYAQNVYIVAWASRPCAARARTSASSVEPLRPSRGASRRNVSKIEVDDEFDLFATTQRVVSDAGW